MAESLASVFLDEPRYGGLLLDYTSPAVVCSAVGLMLLFSRVRVEGLSARVVGFCAPLCFGVYLLHQEPLVREYLIAGRFAGYADLGPASAVLAVLGTAAAIFVVGILVDAVRARIFALARVDAVCDWVGGRIDRLLVGDAVEKELASNEDEDSVLERVSQRHWRHTWRGAPWNTKRTSSVWPSIKASTHRFFAKGWVTATDGSAAPITPRAKRQSSLPAPQLKTSLRVSS
ncbi:MAG: hypothetical protein Q4A01_11250 [Coriobacteriales bacterium]|nr:hypothetical protein [Coriobacteriales bacterium]